MNTIPKTISDTAPDTVSSIRTHGARTRRRWLFLLLPLLCLPLMAVAEDDTREAEQTQAHGHEAAEQTHIADDIAEQAGIRTLTAGPGLIERHLQVYGRLVVPPTAKASLHARFPGVVSEIAVMPGEQVRKGQLLARIEANSSLQTYALRAPIDASVQAVQAGIGESVGAAAFIELINTDRLWVELKIFPAERALVKVGQTLSLTLGGQRISTQLTSVTPVGDQPYVLARAPIDNTALQAVPGELIEARLLVQTESAALVVDNRALQDFEDGQVVFVKVGETYEARPLQLGLRDETHTQVLSGLAVGDRYVVDNSYLIKADILKSGAVHDH